MKKCKKCGIEKELDMFSNVKVNGKLYKQPRCKKCRSEYRNAKRKENPELESIRKRNQKLRSKYGIDNSEYQMMYDKQEGRCKICNIHLKLLCVDHCHDSKVIRGLLCNHCNTALGSFKDNIENLNNAIKYLKSTNTCK